MTQQYTQVQKKVLENPKWQTNRISSQIASQYKVILFIAVVLNVVAASVIYFGWRFMQEAIDDSPIFYTFLLFPFGGIALLIYAIKGVFAWKKFGGSPLVMEPFPGEVGATVAGHIDVGIPYEASKEATVTLLCLRHRSKVVDGKTDYEVTTKWEKEIVVSLATSGIGSRINFHFETPENLPESELQDDIYHEWKVKVYVPLKGLDFKRQFIIPVMKYKHNSSIRYER